MAEQVSTGEQVQARTGAMLEETRARAGETVRRVAEEGGGFIDNQKRLAAVELDGYACALHETARVLHDQTQHAVADYTDRAADALDRLARNLRDKEIGDAFYDVTDFARRQPGVFIGGAVAVGFLLTRFMKSSTHEEPSKSSEMKSKISEKASEMKAKVSEKASEVKSKMQASEEETAPTEAGPSEPYTSADIEIPVILKPHEPMHPGGQHS